jgi:hypothetical protein
MKDSNNKTNSNTPKVANLAVTSKKDRDDDDGSFQVVSHR